MAFAGYAFGGVFVVLGLMLIIRAFTRPAEPAAAPPLPPAQISTDGMSPLRTRDSHRRPVGSTIFRVLRLRGKAALPDVAEGAGWGDAAAPNVQHLSREERATLAGLWLISARMEHASIAAFSQLSLHLAALGASSVAD